MVSKKKIFQYLTQKRNLNVDDIGKLTSFQIKSLYLEDFLSDEEIKIKNKDSNIRRKFE